MTVSKQLIKVKIMENKRLWTHYIAWYDNIEKYYPLIKEYLKLYSCMSNIRLAYYKRNQPPELRFEYIGDDATKVMIEDILEQIIPVKIRIYKHY